MAVPKHYEAVYDYYREGHVCGPTEVGLALGLKYDRASSAVMASIKKMVGLGVLVVVKKGIYKMDMGAK